MRRGDQTSDCITKIFFILCSGKTRLEIEKLQRYATPLFTSKRQFLMKSNMLLLAFELNTRLELRSFPKHAQRFETWKQGKFSMELLNSYISKGHCLNLGETVFHLAVRSGSEKISKIILDMGADIDIKVKKKRTLFRQRGTRATNLFRRKFF